MRGHWRLHLRPVRHRARRTDEAVRVGRRLGILRHQAPVLRGVLDRREQVFLVRILPSAFATVKYAARVEADAGALRQRSPDRPPPRIRCAASPRIARALRQIAAGIVEYFELALGQDGVDGLLVAWSAWSMASRSCSRSSAHWPERNLIGRSPIPRCRPVAPTSGEATILCVGALGQPAVVVAEHHSVAAVVVEEVEEDAFLLQQPADEVVGGLAVLHAVVALRMLAVQPPRLLADAEVAQDLIDDLLDASCPGRSGNRWCGSAATARHQPDAIHAQAAAAPLHHGKARDDAVDGRAQAGGVVQPDGGRRAEQICPGLIAASVEASSRS